MKIRWLQLLHGSIAILAVHVALRAAAGALIIGGGGSAATDCLAVFQVADGVPLKGNKISCVDGDPSCDADGVVNGSCQIPVGRVRQQHGA